MTKATKKTAGTDAGSWVYCGPTIPGVAKRFTIYRTGIPKALAAAKARDIALAQLILPLDMLPEAMRQFREKTGPINTLYQSVQGKR